MINNEELNFLNTETPKDNNPTKEDLQIKKLQLQIEVLEEKKKAQQQKQQPQKSTLSKTINILIYVLSAILNNWIFCDRMRQSISRKRTP